MLRKFRSAPIESGKPSRLVNTMRNKLFTKQVMSIVNNHWIFVSYSILLYNCVSTERRMHLTLEQCLKHTQKPASRKQYTVHLVRTHDTRQLAVMLNMKVG